MDATPCSSSRRRKSRTLESVDPAGSCELSVRQQLDMTPKAAGTATTKRYVVKVFHFIRSSLCNLLSVFLSAFFGHSGCCRSHGAHSLTLSVCSGLLPRHVNLQREVVASSTKDANAMLVVQVERNLQNPKK